MSIFPGSLACCGFDAAESVEIDITSSDAYGYIQIDRGSVWTTDRYYTEVYAWPGLPPTLSLSPVTAPSNEIGSRSYYCWSNQKVFNGTDFPCSNYSFGPLLKSSWRFTMALRNRGIEAFPNLDFTVHATGPRIFSRFGSSSPVAPLSSSDALSPDHESIASAAGWFVSVPREHFNSTSNVTTRSVLERCACLGRDRHLDTRPGVNTVWRPTGAVPITLTGCNYPMTVSESYGAAELGGFSGATLLSTNMASSSVSGWRQLDFSLTITEIRLVFASSQQPLISGFDASQC